jgi:hypothetical protein
MALLLQHAAAIGAGRPLDKDASLPHYRLLCTTLPSKERGPWCNTLALLRGEGKADLPAVATQALDQFIAAGSALLGRGAQPSPGPGRP